jgi:hypothetical protein
MRSRDAFVAMIKRENSYREVWERWSLKAHRAGVGCGFDNQQLQRRWCDFEAGWGACEATPNAALEKS